MRFGADHRNLGDAGGPFTARRDEGIRVHEDDLRTPLRAGLYTALLEAGTTSAFAGRALDVLRDLCGARPLGIVLLQDGKAMPLAGADEDVTSCDRAACRTASGGGSPLEEVVATAQAPAATGAGTDPAVPVHVGHLDAVTPGAGEGEPGTARDPARLPWHLAMAAVGFERVTVLTAPVRAGTDLVVTWYHGVDRPDLSGPAVLCVQELARSIALQLRADEQATDNADLVKAMASRATIDHAIGVLMAVHQCTADEAMVRLREASRRQNMKLRDLASSLVRDVTGNSPAPPAPFRARPGGIVGQPVR